MNVWDGEAEGKMGTARGRWGRQRDVRTTLPCSYGIRQDSNRELHVAYPNDPLLSNPTKSPQIPRIVGRRSKFGLLDEKIITTNKSPRILPELKKWKFDEIQDQWRTPAADGGSMASTGK